MITQAIDSSYSFMLLIVFLFLFTLLTVYRQTIIGTEPRMTDDGQPGPETILSYPIHHHSVIMTTEMSVTTGLYDIFFWNFFFTIFIILFLLWWGLDPRDWHTNVNRHLRLPQPLGFIPNISNSQHCLNQLKMYLNNYFSRFTKQDGNFFKSSSLLTQVIMSTSTCYSMYYFQRLFEISAGEMILSTKHVPMLPVRVR